ERHCAKYTGTRPPSSRAHSSQMLTPRTCSQRTLVYPRRNHSSSRMIERVCSRLVVISGKPWDRSERIWRPNRLRVPVPVRSPLALPVSSTSRSRSSYGVGIVIGSSLLGGGLGRCGGGLADH